MDIENIPCTSVVPEREAPRRAGAALRDRRFGEVHQLLARRPELRGINAFADAVAEDVTWTA